MTKLIVKSDDWFCNLPVDNWEEDDKGMFRGYYKGKVMGIFDVGSINAIYITESKDGN